MRIQCHRLVAKSEMCRTYVLILPARQILHFLNPLFRPISLLNEAHRDSIVRYLEPKFLYAILSPTHFCSGFGYKTVLNQFEHTVNPSKVPHTRSGTLPIYFTVACVIVLIGSVSSIADPCWTFFPLYHSIVVPFVTVIGCFALLLLYRFTTTSRSAISRPTSFDQSSTDLKLVVSFFLLLFLITRVK